MKSQLLLLLLLTLFSCSKQNSESTNSSTDNIGLIKKTPKEEHPSDTSSYLHKIAIQSVACFFKPIATYEIIEQHLNGRADSILFISENILFKQPIGQFYSAPQILAKFPNLNHSSAMEDPDSTGKVQVHIFKSEGNTFKMFENQDTPHDLVLTSGLISKPGISIYNKVYIGMKKQDFVKIFFKNPDFRCACVVYSFAYVVDSEVQHFTFEKDTLVKIQLTSNYTIQ